MIKIKEAFQNKKAFIAYLMAGDPDLQACANYILTAQEAGADLIEIGIPFSDPIAEGEVIQAAAARALSAGTRLDAIFDMVESIKDKMRIPMVFMTYLNPVFVYGYDRFFARCAKLGISGIIIPDMPFEEQGEAKEPAEKHGIEIITMIAPTSEKRIADITKNAQGFVYLVSSMGVTGVRSTITTDLSSIIESIRKTASIPIAIGFGISTPEQAQHFSKQADGIIVGSAIVKLIGEHGHHAKQSLYDYIKTMKNAVMMDIIA
ncbi:MAG: tryptophan synthase subunit alpha [Alphaproteobacteria bacterium]|nr:tryptophan synthase subunit alpha [Alphaproteobacteria bacterium]